MSHTAKTAPPSMPPRALRPLPGRARKAALTDAAMQSALATIANATADMKVVSGNIKAVTAFVTDLATFIGGGTMVVSALRGI